MSDQTPLALTDDQLDQIVRCAAPLHPELRRVFVEHVAYALRGKTISDGTVYLACRQVLRESGMFFRPTSGSAPVTGNMTDLGAARGRAHARGPSTAGAAPR